MNSLLLLFFFRLFLLNPLLIKRIVRISLSSKLTPIKSSKIPCRIYLLPSKYPLSQIRITNVQPSKTDHISPTISYRSNTLLRIERIIPYYYSIEKWSECFTYILDLLRWSYCVMAFHRVELC